MVSKLESEEESMLSGRQSFLDGLHIMDSRFSGMGEEDEELVPGKRVFTGLKFEDEESRITAQRVGCASLAMALLAILHAIVQATWRHDMGNMVLHLTLGLLLPVIGYRGAVLDDNARWRPRLLWAFHVGNVIFVLVHAVILASILVKVHALERAGPEQVCGSGALRPGKDELYRHCTEEFEDEKRRAPGLLALWCLLSVPYWGCATYAAYHCHELYLQLRIQGLTVCRGRSIGDSADVHLATVAWAEDVDPTAE